MSVAVGLQYILGFASLGSPIGSDKYQYGHHVIWLPDRFLAGCAVGIISFDLQVSGVNGGGVLLVFLDHKMEASNESLWPLTQNANYLNFELVAQLAYQTTAANAVLSSRAKIDPPIPYVPGQDGIVYVMDGTATNGAGFVLLPRVLMDYCADWTDPSMMPDPDCVAEIAAGRQGGNDRHTFLLLHCKGVNGSPLFQDNSWRNYTVRYFGGVRVLGNQAHFDGTGILAPELLPPGYGDDLNPAHCDWNPGAGDFTLDLWVTPSGLGSGAIAGFTKWWGPFLVRQIGSQFAFHATTANSTWNIADAQSMGTAAAGAPTHLAVVRSGSSLLLFNNGVQVNSFSVGSTPMFYPLTAAGGPMGRLSFGAQCDIDSYGNVSMQTSTGQFVGTMREMRWSKIARWTANFTPPSAPYSP